MIHNNLKKCTSTDNSCLIILDWLVGRTLSEGAGGLSEGKVACWTSRHKDGMSSASDVGILSLRLIWNDYWKHMNAMEEGEAEKHVYKCKK